MNVEVLAHAIWIYLLFWSDLSVQSLAVVHPILMSDSFLRIRHLISHQLLQYPFVDLAAPVGLLREDMFAHAIWTVPWPLFL